MSKEVQNNKPKNIVLYQMDNSNIYVNLFQNGTSSFGKQKLCAKLPRNAQQQTRIPPLFI